MHPYRLFCTPGARNPVKYNGFCTLRRSQVTKSDKNHWFLQYFQPREVPRWGQDGLQDEAKMGSKKSSKMGSKMGSPRASKVAIPFEREAKIHKPVWASEREARLLKTAMRTIGHRAQVLLRTVEASGCTEKMRPRVLETSLASEEVFREIW